MTDFVDNGIRQKITSVTLQTANDQTITAGRYDGIDLYALCPYATQEMALAILVQVQDYQYQAFDAKAAGIDPAAELGDGVNVCGIYGVLSSIEDPPQASRSLRTNIRISPVQTGRFPTTRTACGRL